jgi:2-polyprenyl-3-methyl-5-hydroxy-6-metoxy-1,4-benzoquinol methylase
VNRYDDVRLDLPRLFKDQEATLAPWDPRARSGDGLGLGGALAGRARLAATALSYRLGLHQRLVYSHLALDWFQEFREYWMSALGNRPLEPHDFAFLLGVYRQRFQGLDADGLAVDERPLEAWQDPRSLYLLFAHHFRTAVRPLSVHRYVPFIPRGARVCEYGCGVAPLATSLVRYYPHLRLAVTCADLPTVLFHFARWKFRHAPFVRTVVIDPADDAPLDGEFDVVLCTEVLEHVPRPLALVRHLHSRLAPGGILVFDYIRSEGQGLDTVGGLRDRLPALAFVRESFDVVQGAVPLDGASVDAVVCRKRR